MPFDQGSPIPGILLHEEKLSNLTNHLDVPQLLPLAAKGSETDFGTLDIWALTHKEDLPFMVANLENQSIEYVNGNQYYFSLPTAGDNSTYLEEVYAEGQEKIGYGGMPFKILVSNARLGGFGSRIMFDPMTPFVMEVTDLQRKGEKVLYTVKYSGNYKGDEYIPQHLLQGGSRLYKTAATRSKEFGQNYDSWAAGSTTKRKFMGFLTNAQLQTHYHMTDQACNFADGMLVKDKAWVMQNLDSVVQYIGINAPLDSGIKYLKDYVDAGGNSPIGFRALAMKYDEISMGLLAKEAMNTIIWDPGSPTGFDGFDKDFIAPGLWHQLDFSGYKHTFNIETFSADVILAAIRDYNAGKVQDPQYGGEPVYRIRTGRGGHQLLNKSFEKYLTAAVTGMTFADKLGQISGTAKTGLDLNLSWYKSITIPGEAKLVIEEDPSLDPWQANEFVNPRLSTGYRLSSYSMIIENYNTSSSNIKILRNKYLNGGGMRMEVINGDRSHPLYEMNHNGIPVHQGSDLSTGFGAFFRMTPDTPFVVDPTQLLKLVPKNPITGLATM